MTEEYYSNLVDNLKSNIIPNNTTMQVNKNFDRMDSVNSNSININTDKNLNIKNKYLDKRGSNILSESMTSEEINPKIKKELIGKSDNTTQSYGKIFSFGTKNKSSSKFILDELEEEKIIQIRKKKPEE
jgi:hypothetical protein